MRKPRRVQFASCVRTASGTVRWSMENSAMFAEADVAGCVPRQAIVRGNAHDRLVRLNAVLNLFD